MKFTRLIHQSFPQITDHTWENITFDHCNFGIKGPCTIYKGNFIRCTFLGCSFNVNVAYSNFISCTFKECQFFNAEDKALAYKSNFDGSLFDILTNIKLKKCSLNGTMIGLSKRVLFVKCSDKYLTIMNTEDSTKVTHSNRKIVRMNAQTPPKGSVKTVSGGSVKSTE